MAGELLGIPVPVAVGLQRVPPQVVLVLCGVELASFGLLAITASLGALVATGTAGAALLVVAAVDRRRVLAVTGDGLVVLAASRRGRPRLPASPAPAGLRLPEAVGLGAPVELADGRWWVDRSGFARLRRAHELQDGAATGGGSRA